MMQVPPATIRGATQLSVSKLRPVRGNGNRQKEVQVNEVLTHPMAESVQGASRERWKYSFLRVTRLPTVDRPDSGRILTENKVSGERKEFYALLFNVHFI